MEETPARRVGKLSADGFVARGRGGSSMAWLGVRRILGRLGGGPCCWPFTVLKCKSRSFGDWPMEEKIDGRKSPAELSFE